MAVIRARSLDCPGFLILSLLLLGAGRVLCEGNPESPSAGAPTVSQCRPHIEAALKDFVTHHKEEQSSPTEEALHAGEQSEVDTSPTEAGELTDKGDTAGEDTANLTEKDDDETQVEGDDDETEGAEGEDEDSGEEGDQTEAEGTAGDEETAADGEDQTKGDDDDDQTVDEQNEETNDGDATGENDDEETADDDDKTVGGEGETEDDEKTAGDEGDTAAEGEEETAGTEGEGDETEDGEATEAGEGDEETEAGEGDEETEAGEGDEETEAGEGDEETEAGEGDEETEAGEGDEETEAGEEDEETEAGEETAGAEETADDDDDDEATAGGKDEGTEDDEDDDDDEPTVAEETGGDDDDEKTKTGDEDEETEAGGGEGATAEVEGDEAGEETEDDDTKADDDQEGSEEGNEGEATEGDEETAADETKEGEEAGDAGTAEDVSEAAETEGSAADEPSGEDGQQSGEDADGDGTEEEASEPAASEGDECGGEGQSEADEPEEEEETVAEEKEARVKVSRGGLRSRSHIEEILGLDDASISSAVTTEKLIQNILKDLKRMYESAIKPMELLYKFKDISNRYVGDSEIFSKPMILFIGPWSSGKSTIINYLLDNEDTENALPTGAEPKSSDFTVLTHGDGEEMLGGTELAADWTFSTMQKFGQAFLDQLKGMKLPNNLLRKITIVDTPGILENRKIQERTYPFNDVCQWFIDRADIIYVVFDPTKLDMGLEMEALFDQLKGREAQVRIVLNKADTVSPQELMRVQSTLLWNLSPLLGSSEAPTIFVGNFWSRPYVKGSPSTLFEAQEEALLYDLRQVIVGRVENKISFTRRHAVRVRNHAKMVDCYLNTYYNHKTFFGNKKKVADDIIENPQSYHIYEGLSTLTNVSRYDLPDPDIYRDFFRVNPLYEFKQLASTCSFFKGCPLDKLDLTISFELPELMGKYRKLVGATAHGAGGDRR